MIAAPSFSPHASPPPSLSSPARSRCPLRSRACRADAAQPALLTDAQQRGQAQIAQQARERARVKRADPHTPDPAAAAEARGAVVRAPDLAPVGKDVQGEAGPRVRKQDEPAGEPRLEETVRRALVDWYAEAKTGEHRARDLSPEERERLKGLGYAGFDGDED